MGRSCSPRLTTPPRNFATIGAFTIRVVNLPWLNVVDGEWLTETIAGIDQVFTLDDHYVDGGQGRMLGSQIAQLGLGGAVTVHHLGVRDIPACGQNDEVLRFHRLDAASLAEDIAAVLAPRPAA